MDPLHGRLLLGALVLLAMAAGGWRWGWVRGPAMVLVALVAAVATFATAFFLYAGFAWTSRGGGTLLLFVLPAAVLAWVAFVLLGAARGARADTFDSNLSQLLDTLRRLRGSK
jgi:hypothetical protein